MLRQDFFVICLAFEKKRYLCTLASFLYTIGFQDESSDEDELDQKFLVRGFPHILAFFTPVIKGSLIGSQG